MGESETDKKVEPLDLEARLAAARSRKQERDLKAEEEDKRRELEALELEERFEKELGPVGEKFVIVSAGHRGSVVVKLGLNVLHKAFNASIEDNQKKGIGGPTGVTEENCSKFVKPNVVFPSVDEFKNIIEELPGVLYRCAGMLSALYGADRAQTRGKS